MTFPRRAVAAVRRWWDITPPPVDVSGFVQLAIDASAEAGVPVDIPAGTYHISSLRLDRPVQIIGAGRDRTWRKS